MYVCVSEENNERQSAHWTDAECVHGFNPFWCIESYTKFAYQNRSPITQKYRMWLTHLIQQVATYKQMVWLPITCLFKHLPINVRPNRNEFTYLLIPYWVTFSTLIVTERTYNVSNIEQTCFSSFCCLANWLPAPGSDPSSYLRVNSVYCDWWNRS